MGHGSRTLDSGEGKKVDHDAIAKDKAVADGLRYLGGFLGAAAPDQSPGIGGQFVPNALSNNLYFMWSLERVGMVYGLTTIGKVDWYDWGSRCLIKSQE